MIELKNLIENFNSSLDQAEESADSDRSFEIILSRKKKKTNEKPTLKKKGKKAYSTYGIPFNKSLYTLWKSQKEQRKTREQKAYLKKE